MLGRAWPGLGARWDLPAGGPQGDGAATAPTRSGGETRRWADPAPGAPWHEEHQPALPPAWGSAPVHAPALSAPALESPARGKPCQVPSRGLGFKKWLGLML